MPEDKVIIKTYDLGGGLLATITDHTSHYFGGYYHVRIKVKADLPVVVSAFADAVEYEDVVRRLGTSVSFTRTLEKMAVPEAEIECVRGHLLEAFDTNVLPYLLREDFADSFVRSEYRNSLKFRAVSPRYRS